MAIVPSPGPTISKIQNPNWLWSDRDWGRWPCSKSRCMAVLATRVWPSWKHTSLQPKGCRLDSSHARPKLGTDFRWRGFAGNRGSISSPVSWKLGPNFRRNCKPGGVVRNLGLTSRGADHVCKGKGYQHHVLFIQAFKIYINISIYIYTYIIQFLFSAIHNP